MASAARLGDFHTCPLNTNGIPHVGGPIIGPGIPTVLIGGVTPAVLGDNAMCNSVVDTIVKGSVTVLIGGKPAARMGDSTAHGGVITGGLPSVQIGG